MSIRKSVLTLIGLAAALAFSASASAGLYGFTDAHPLTQEEKILDMDFPPETILNYRDLMRNNINMLADFAHEHNPDFQIILHEGGELLAKGLWEYHLEGYEKARAHGIDTSDPSFLAELKQLGVTSKYMPGTRAAAFRQNINAVAYNDLYCTPRKLDREIKDTGLKLIAVSRCPNAKAFDKAAELSVKDGVLLYAFLQPNKAFRHIRRQPIINENARNIFRVNEAANISLLIDDSAYPDKAAMIKDIRNSNYDIVVINPLFHEKEPFSANEVNSLKYKKNGARRLIVAEQNISEATSDAYYWHQDWEIDNPSWLRRLSFANKNGIITEYWNINWQRIMSEYFKSIVMINYDGVFFTGVNNFRYFEKLTPLE